MTDFSMTATSRTQTGRHAKTLRREGHVPAVLYGHAMDQPANLAIDERALAKIWRTAGRTHFVDLKIDDAAPRKVLIRDMQVDPRSARPVHVDFLAVNMREKMTADVPVVITGEPRAVTEFKVGQVLQTISTVKVECLPHDLPAQLTVDVTDLAEVDAHKTVADIVLPAGVTLVHSDSTELVVKIAALRVQAAEEPTEAPAEAAAAPAGESGEAAPSGS